jgi:lipooligosaccharide transport system permease protein
MTVARTFWLILVSGLFEPLFYLLSIGVGIGELAGDITYQGRAIGYTTFVAPALLAASAMNGSIYESTMNVFARLKWQHTYDGMIATPMTPRDIAVGELAYCQLRGAVYSAMFLAVVVAMGLVESWWAVLALPAAVLIGVAFAAAGLAWTTHMRTFQDFEMVPLVQLPLFLLSATFFPLSTYPATMRWVVQLSPLYHGVALMRDLTLGHVDAGAVVHVAYLAVMTLIAARIAFRRFDLLLRP